MWTLGAWFNGMSGEESRRRAGPTFTKVAGENVEVAVYGDFRFVVQPCFDAGFEPVVRISTGGQTTCVHGTKAGCQAIRAALAVCR